MRAAQFAEYGGPEVVQVAEVAEPHPGPGTIRIAVKTAAVNPIDWKFRSGIVKVKSLPHRLGFEAAGVVDEVGDGVDGVEVGDEVFGSCSTGSFAEFAVLDAWAKKPPNMPWTEAAGVTMGAETAARALRVIGVTDGSTLVINGASGGVGSSGVQLAVARGIRVIGVAGASNHAYLRELGAQPVLYGEGLVERIRALAPDGVDFAFDVSGSGVIPELIELTGTPDHVVTIADYGAGKYGVTVSTGGERSWDALQTVADLYQKDAWKVEVQQVFTLEETGAAQAISQAGHVRGKLIIEV